MLKKHLFLVTWEQLTLPLKIQVALNAHSSKSEPHTELVSVDVFLYWDLEILAEHGIIQKKAQEPRAKFLPQSPTEQGESN